MKDLNQTIKRKAFEIEDIIYPYLPVEEGYAKTVLSAMNYTMKAGGKRLRPMLMNETYLLFGGEDRSIIEPFMAAIEMIHTYSLIHDDLPALDNDDLRRGRPTAHVVYGEAMALLAGDGLLNFAFETAAKAFKGDERDVMIAKAFQVLASKPGIYGMIGGQTADVELTDTGADMDLDAIMYIHKNKTSALIECAMMIGAILAGATDDEIRTVERIATNVGIAFQIQDDILDVISTEEKLGKPVGSDEENHKSTYVTLLGIEQAKEDVLAYTDKAASLYDSLNKNNPFLRDLLVFLSCRSY